MSRFARFNKHLNTLFTMGFRIGGLVLKFVLTFYLARYFTLEDIGVYGLVTAAAATMPALLGWGFNYYLSRDVVDASHLNAGRMMRDRILVSLSSYIPVLLAFLAVSHWSPYQIVTTPWLVAGVLLGECLAQDLHLALVGQRKAFLANMLFFIRSAVWIPLFIALGLINPAYRTLGWMFGFWAVFALLNIPLMMLFLRKWPWKAIIASAIDWPWLRKCTSRLTTIYFSDVCQAGTNYLDRYIILHLLGLEMVGIYTLFWSFGNAMYAVIQAGLVQTSLPQLVTLFRAKKLKEYWSYWVSYMLKVQAACVVFSATLLLALPVILPLAHKTELVVYWPLMLLICVGITLRSGSDVMRHSLYSRHMDKILPMLNITGLLVSSAFNVLFLKMYGLWGSGIAMIVTGIALVGMAGWFMAGIFKRDGLKPTDIKVSLR